jgi:hypothetical protein
MSEQISQLQQIGVALASAYGTPSISFTRGLLASKYDANPGKQSVDRVPQVLGTKAIMRVTKGPLDFDVSIDMPLDAGASAGAGIGDFLATLMGTDTATKAGGLATHVFTFKEAALLPSLNLFSTKDAVHKQITGFIAQEIKFTIKSSDNFIPVSITGFAKDEEDLAAAQTLAYSALPLIIPSDAATLKVGGASVANFEQIEISLKSEGERFRPVGLSRAIANIYSKTYRVEIKLTGLNFAAETQRIAYRDVTTSSFELDIGPVFTNDLHFAFPQCNITEFTGPNIADTDLMKINLTLLATGTLANQKVTIGNDYLINYSTGVAIP